MSIAHPVPTPKVAVTVIVAARNESANLRKCLAALQAAVRVIVVDSGSRDATCEIARHGGAEVVQFKYVGGYPKKRQWAMETLEVSTPWTLLVDADEVVPPTLWEEIRLRVSRSDAPDAFLVKKGFHFLGRRMAHGGFSHSAVILFRSGTARFERLVDDPATGLDMEVHERILADGRIGRLRTPLIHEDFKGLEAYIDRHNRYSTWEARLRHAYLTTGSYGEATIRGRLFGNPQERRRALKSLAIRIPLEHWAWFAYHYFLRFGFLEGRPGLIACQIRSSYIAQVRAKVYELRNGTRRVEGR